MWSHLWPKRIRTLLLNSKDEASIAKVHALIILTGLSIHRNSNVQLIATYARVGDVRSARKVFDKLHQRGVDAWNAMITAYSRNESPREVLLLYRQMMLDGVRGDSSSFTIALKACASLMDLKVGEEVWYQAMDHGYEYDVYVGSSVLNLYTKCGKMDRAMVVFDRMPKRDLVCWTTMMTGLVQNGQPREAVDLYWRMIKEGIEGDEVVMVGLVQACANAGDPKLGRSIHGYLIRRSFLMDVVVQTSLLDMYAKHGYLEVASRLFKMMSHKNAISWGALISGFAQNGLAGNALDLLVEMQRYALKPDSVSLIGAILACSQIGFLKLGKSVHGYVMRQLEFDEILCTAMMDMYSKCGALSQARSLFDSLGGKDSVSWNAMIASYGSHGHGEEAVSLFIEMTKANLEPDHATFASLLSALSHSGLVEEGKYWFDIMVHEYKIQPTEKHYACMVDLLARFGYIEEAHELINSMNTEPGLPVWVAFLSGCLKHGKFFIGQLAAKKVLVLDPDDLGIHTLVSNFFAMGKKWDEVAGVRKIMKRTGMKKVPGYSVVEVNGRLQAFLMEDQSHHQYEDIVHILNTLDHDIRVRGDPAETEFLFHNVGLNVQGMVVV